VTLTTHLHLALRLTSGAVPLIPLHNLMAWDMDNFTVEIFALLGCYAAFVGSWLIMFRDNLSDKYLRVDGTELSRNVGKCQSTLRRIPEEGIFRLHHGGSMKSPKFNFLSLVFSTGITLAVQNEKMLPRYLLNLKIKALPIKYLSAYIRPSDNSDI